MIFILFSWFLRFSLFCRLYKMHLNLHGRLVCKCEKVAWAQTNLYGDNITSQNRCGSILITLHALWIPIVILYLFRECVYRWNFLMQYRRSLMCTCIRFKWTTRRSDNNSSKYCINFIAETNKTFPFWGGTVNLCNESVPTIGILENAENILV